MTDELHEIAPEANAENPSTMPPIAPAALGKSRKNLWIIAGSVLAVLCVCSTLCAALIAVSGYKVYIERAPVESVLDSYMRYMSGKDAESAYSLFSPRAQRQFSVSKLEEFLQGNNFILFEGYQNLSVSEFNISAAVNTNPNLPQGTVAKVTGVVHFEDDVEGSFKGTLEKVDDKWMIYSIFVTVPPSKMKSNPDVLFKSAGPAS